MNQTPEQKARDQIDRMLAQAGWSVQEMAQVNWGAGAGIALREYPTANGPADYLLFVNRAPVGVIEAKREEEGQHLTVVEEQSAAYAAGKLKWIAHNQPLPFLYESTGVLTRFTDTRDSKPRSRLVFGFHRPETFLDWQKEQGSLRRRVHNLPQLSPDGLRGCQIRAITRLEQSFKENRPRALIQMATGSGKTFTAITFIYRLLKFAGARRALFLVDTKNLGEQAEQEFMAYTPNDDKRTFTELYGAQRLRSSYVASDSQVCISTIQRMYSILRGEELDEGAEETSLYEIRQPANPKEVVYNPELPPEFFDFIVIDECHRSIYNLWRQVLEYFDAFLIGLTATPDQRTFAFFHENVVSEYSHEDAVADGVNVGHEVYTIETEISAQGAKIAAREFVDKRDRLTRRKRWEQLDDDFEYAASQLDRDVVNPSQIRKVIRTLRDKLPEIFPGRAEIPKTLIFAKSDSHADDIIQIVREEFGEGNDFCKKVTYREKDPKKILADFRTDYNPRIAVTVDMIATGTDVKPLECLVFMRDVKSRNYFEQMKGRGTRTLSYDDLKKVTPSVISNKTHYVIVDAVGVTKSVKTDSRPLERKKSVPLKDLMLSVMMGGADEDTFLSLASRLGRLEKQITPQERQRFAELAQGKSINQVIHELLDAYNPDTIENQARTEFQLNEVEPPSAEQIQAAQETLIRKVRQTFSTGEFVNYVDNVRRSHEQIIDMLNLDRLRFAGWDQQAQGKAEETIRDFSAFLAAHKDEIAALRIFYDQPYRRRDVTYRMMRETLDALRQNKPTLAPLHVWRAFEQIEQVKGQSPKNELIALVALIRRVCGLDEVLTSFDTTVNQNFKQWVFQKNAGPKQFTEEQMAWLRMIKDHILASVHIERGDLDYAPFDAQGGLGKMYQLFGDDMDALLDELNEALAA